MYPVPLTFSCAVPKGATAGPQAPTVHFRPALSLVLTSGGELGTRNYCVAALGQPLGARTVHARQPREYRTVTLNFSAPTRRIQASEPHTASRGGPMPE